MIHSHDTPVGLKRVNPAGPCHGDLGIGTSISCSKVDFNVGEISSRLH